MQPAPALSRLARRYGSRRLTFQQVCWSGFLTLKGRDRFEHYKQALWLTLPSLCDSVQVMEPDAKAGKPLRPSYRTTNHWNPWMEKILWACTQEEYATRRGNNVFRSVVLTGCGSAGKTHALGLFAYTWWAAEPHNSIAILTSTTVGMIRQRIWPVITSYWGEMTDPETGLRLEVGHLVDSQMRIDAVRADKGSGSRDAKHALFAKAVAHGETAKAIHDLKGLHAARMLLVIDEANGTPDAIFEIIPNYRKGCQDLTVVIIGNPGSRMDAHGRALEPEGGWGLLAPDALEWRTKGVPEWQLESGVALRFDGKESPNVKAGRNLYPYIFTVEDWQAAEAHEGTHHYWIMARGMHPPEGFSCTVMSETMLVRCGGFKGPETVEFDASGRTLVAFLDPAFGGDDCVLQFAEVGGVLGTPLLLLTETMEVPIDPNSLTHERDYQVARFVMQECRTRGVAPEHFGLDATGTGRGVAAILKAEWSEQIHATYWGAMATERPSAGHDGRPAREVYSNFVTELWFSVREAVEAGQLRGLKREAAVQFCTRQYDPRMTGRKYKLEPKDEFKLRLRYSPDEADSVAGVLEVARRAGLITLQSKLAEAIVRSTKAEVLQLQENSGLDLEVATAGEGGGWASEGW